MLGMVAYSRRPQSGHIMCYLNRTYHVLPTRKRKKIDTAIELGQNMAPLRFSSLLLSPRRMVSYAPRL
jgi:hypothetical protein